jgi:hypothetical protein
VFNSRELTRKIALIVAVILGFGALTIVSVAAAYCASVQAFAKRPRLTKNTPSPIGGLT